MTTVMPFPAFKFENQFAMARGAAGAELPPVYVYATETAIQMTLTELNENLREIYIEAYTQREASEYIHRETAEELYRIFGPTASRRRRSGRSSALWRGWTSARSPSG